MHAPIFYAFRRRYATMTAEALRHDAAMAAIDAAGSFSVEAVLDSELRQRQRP